MARPGASPPSPQVIFDTDVLVHYFRGDARAAAFVRAVRHSQRTLSAVAYMELLQGARDSQELDTLALDLRRNFSEIVPIDEESTHQAVRLIERHALGDGLRVADALVAASALVRGAELATSNERHFRVVKGLRLKVYRR